MDSEATTEAAAAIEAKGAKAGLHLTASPTPRRMATALPTTTTTTTQSLLTLPKPANGTDASETTA